METTVASTALETKLIQLKLAMERTDGVLAKSSEESIARHQTTLRNVIAEVDKLHLTVEAEKVGRKEDTTEWSKQIETKLNEADGHVQLTKEWLAANKRKLEEIERNEKLQFEVKLHETKMKLHVEQNVEGSPQATKSMIGMQAKLPKLVISQFNGSHMDWPRFWGQFTENIEKSSIAPVTKFAYLRELLAPKVRKTVEALPFTPEGYNRAKSLLQDKFGKESEIVKVYTREILGLPTINNTHTKKIHEFNEKLTYCVQALETLKRLEGVNGAVPMTLDKLPSIRGDLVRTDPEWEKWDFAKLVEALNQWCRRNPIEKPAVPDEEYIKKREKLYHVNRPRLNPRGCTYCDDNEHKANECTKVTSTTARKQILSKKRLCFNCAAGNHKASDCPSKASCRKCDKRHHTSICDKSDGENPKKDVAMTTCQKSEAIFPIVVVEVNGIKCRALIDSGAGSSYVSTKLIELLKLKPSQTLVKNIDMLMASKTSKLEIYDMKLDSLNGSFSLPVKATKVNKSELLSIDNPNYPELITQHPHLKGVTMNDNDVKDSLPVHVILGSGEYAKIKSQTKPRIGSEKAPIAELTKFGWFLMGPGYEFDSNVMLLTQTSQVEYEELCRLDVLGLEDTPRHDQSMVFSEFKEQLTRSPEGWYETTLPWKPNHPELPNNEYGSMKRLKSLTKKLRREHLTEKYDTIIREQLAEGVIEKVPHPLNRSDTPSPHPSIGSDTQVPKTTEGDVNHPSSETGSDLFVAESREFYIPHKYVIRESAQTTKMRIVCDASARATPEAPSLNDCLYTGPPLQNKIWDILVQQRTYPVGVAADIKQAFLQIRVKESERNALKFHWQPSINAEVETYRFTRVLFGLAPSPFLLGGVIESHLDAWSMRYPEEVARLRRSFYVDDLLSGGNDVPQAQARKERAIEIMKDATFELHKWNSNCPELEGTRDVNKCEDRSFAKQQFQVSPNESSLLGLKWDKAADRLSVVFPRNECATTKREVLRQLAKVYDPLGLASPTTLLGKLIFRDICDSKIAWDAPLTKELRRRWERYEHSLPQQVSTPRPLAPHHQPTTSVELHTFGDASINGVGTAVYSVVRQENGTTQTLVAAKSRLAKKGLTVPRLELVSAHMATNLVTNVRNAWADLKEVSIFGWLDSSVALHWILGNGQYRQFVSNRVKKIKGHPEIQWRYVPTNENPADIASRGGQVADSELWWRGPEWLSDATRWPENPITGSSPASEAEAKVIKEVLSLAQQPSKKDTDVFDELLERHDLPKALRIQARVRRFCTGRVHSGPVTSEEVRKEKMWWIKRAQNEDSKNPHFVETSRKLNLVKNNEGIYECRGRLQGSFPTYLPADALFTKKLVQRTHVETLHGGVLLTMAAVRETYWIPKLRKLVKSVRGSCWGCKRFTAVPIVKPPPGSLPTDRTEGGAAFQVIGTDFAGPIRHRMANKREGKSYLLIFSCSLSRAVHLELVQNLKAGTFIQCLKRLIARRGRPAVIYSDNGATFLKAAKWLKQVRNDERVQGLLQEYDMIWKFNLSRAPWWGGQFERLIGVVKSAMYKVIGGATLSWSELSEVLLDIEIQINRRPLSYIEDDVELPALTPATFLFQRTSQLPENQPWRNEDKDLRKRAKYLRSCKESLWKRWRREYLTALRERHNLVHKTSKQQIKIGDAVIVRTDDKNRGKWPMAIVMKLFPGSDGRTRGVQLKTKNGIIERPVQHLYPLELQCDLEKTGPEKKIPLNPLAKDFRPKRAAAMEASKKIKESSQAVEDD